MKTAPIPAFRRLPLFVLTAVLAFASSAPPAFAALPPVPPLTFSGLTSASVTITWFADTGVSYQLEKSADLVTWTNAADAVAGTDNYVNINVSLTGQERLFFRLQPPPPDVLTAVFAPLSGLLTITGGDQDNAITVSRDAEGNILVNGGAVTITGGTATVGNTASIVIFGRDGSDTLTLDESNGALPGARLSGEGGDDTLTGGSGADILDGGPGADILLGKGGADVLSGGDQDDTLTGGPGDDQTSGDNHSDRIIWNPGDGTDVIEGGDGTDTVEINGDDGGESFTTTANGTRVRFDRLNPAPFSLDIGTCEHLVLNANGGDDSFSATGNLAALIQITVDGGAGNDTLLGSNGADILRGGGDNDSIDGQQGNDTIFLGDGDDMFQWDPGDGSDTVEGEAGNDTMIFNGANIAEIIEVSANGSRVRFTRNIASIVMDLAGMETVEYNALGGSDGLNVGDLAGTGLTNVIADLASTTTGNTGDAAADAVDIIGTGADDIITATMTGTDLLVTGLAVSVRVHAFEAALDVVRIHGLGGDDIMDGSAVSGGPPLMLSGGTGSDVLLGSAGPDTLLGGENDDLLMGNGGSDILDGGTGDNTLIQDGPNVTSGIVTVFGDGADNSLVLSRDAAGVILLNGAPLGTATVANTSLIRVFGAAGNDTITLDETNGALPASMIFGGAGNDTLTGGSGGDVLFGGAGNDALLGKGGFDLLFGGSDDDTLTGGDADDQAFGEAGDDVFIWNPGDDTDLNEGGSGTDTVQVNGGNGDESFTTTANGTRVRFDRLNPAPFSIDIGTSENLRLHANGGNDSFSATGNLAVLIRIIVDGGPGNDTLLGSNGNDFLFGGDDNDFIDGQQGGDAVAMGDGDDTFQWDPGDGNDSIEGQAGADTLLFNGSAGAEVFEVSANNTRVRLTRNLGNIITDLEGVETIDLNAFGGVDLVTVNDLAATGLTNIITDLAAPGGAGDAAADAISINGTSGDDIVTTTFLNGELVVTGLVPTLRIQGAEAAIDIVRIQGLAGEDIVDASATGAGVVQLQIDGGAGNDILLGAAGTDTLLGGENDDVLIGNGGSDILDGSSGENIVIQDGTNVTDGIVTVFGDAGDDLLTISRDAAGALLLNGAPLGTATVANTALIRVFGRAGNDTITLDESLGALPAAFLFGGSGDDILTGGSGNDFLFGGSNNDNLPGKGGFDMLFGGADADILTGGDADDQAFGEAGPDRFVWNPGDDTDLNEGGSGPDIVEVNGGNGAESFTTTANGTRVRFDRLNPAPFAIDIGTCEDLQVNANGGDDSFSAIGNLAVLIEITVDGGPGNDTLLGSNGADVLIGGMDNDFIDGQQGNDSAFLGDGDDTFQWDPGDGSDFIFGEAGSDKILFNGSAGSEIFDLSANGSHGKFTRNLGNIVMDFDGIETFDLNLLGGVDSLTVNNLTGTALTSVIADLAGTFGGTTGDGAADTIILNGTPAADLMSISAPAAAATLFGLPATVSILSSEAANDKLIVNGLGGADSLTIGPGVSSLIGITFND